MKSHEKIKEERKREKARTENDITSRNVRMDARVVAGGARLPVARWCGCIESGNSAVG